MRDVAEHAGVSVKTVSNVVNGYAYLRPETRDRVLASIAELGYEMNVSARGLRSGRTRMISLVVPGLRTIYHGELVDSVMDAAEAHGLTTVIENTRGSRAKELAVVSGGGRGGVDGVLFIPTALRRTELAAAGPTFPLVLMGDNIAWDGADRVTARNQEASAAAVRHLLDGGRRRIALVGADRSTRSGNFHKRLRGYLAAHAEAGVPVDDALMVVPHADQSAEGVAAVDELVERGGPFDALFCLSDRMAIGALYALRRHGFDVPGDVAVMGFDDTEEARYTSPPLTSVAQGREETARTAVDLLVARIDERLTGRPPAPFVERYVDFSIAVRASA